MISPNLPQLAYSAQQVKENEAKVAALLGIDMYQLMQAAANSVFSVLNTYYPEAKRVLVIAGGGNNGGDGYLVAKQCLAHGIDTVVFAAKPVETLTGDAAKAAAEYCAANGAFVSAICGEFDVVVDALLGIGFSGVLSDEYQTIIATVNRLACDKIAVDLPSGIDATSGAVERCAVNANHTVTFIALKQGLLTGAAVDYIGKLHFAPLGMADAFCKTISSSVTVLQLAQLINHLPVRQPSSYKNQHGHVLLIGGDSGMGGAIRLASEACLRAGAGLVSVATHPTNVSAVLSGRYELMVQGVEKSAQLHQLIKKANCVVVGPGLGQSSWGQMIWQSLLSTELPESMVIDADGLNFMVQGTMPNATNVVITPHLGEAARLLGCEKRDIELNRFNAVLKLVDKYNVVSLLKGPGSIICDGNQYQINLSGTPSMASAGMGDVLSGIIGAFLASRLSAFDAASLGAAIHGLAGEQAQVGGKRGMLAADLFPFIRQLVE